MSKNAEKTLCHSVPHVRESSKKKTTARISDNQTEKSPGFSCESSLSRPKTTPFGQNFRTARSLKKSTKFPNQASFLHQFFSEFRSPMSKLAAPPSSSVGGEGAQALSFSMLQSSKVHLKIV